MKEPRAPFLRGLLDLGPRIQVVDIGANPIGDAPPYWPLLQQGVCQVTGFEPQLQALATLKSKKGPFENYLPYAVGDGEEHELKVCRASGMTSILEPDRRALELFQVLLPLGDVLERTLVKTKRLDDIEEVERVDFLKIDVQGSELSIFQHGREKLADAVAIQTEISFNQVYKDQPTFGEIDGEVRSQGFIPHCFFSVKRWMIAPLVVNNDARKALNHLLEADIVYVRDFTKPENFSDDQLKFLATISDVCYRSYDLANRCILILEERGVVDKGSAGVYVRSLGDS